MRKRILLSLLLFSFLSSCASPAPTVAPVLEAPPTLETEPAEWWRDAVFYEIFVRSFYDTNDDGIGDFNGITQKLDYLEALGINAIWLMPIHPSPSYHGYDVINYYAVNHEYGTMDDFKRLLDEAHKRNIHIIIDLVLNHTSSQHPWFVNANQSVDSEYRNYYVWSEDSQGSGWHQGNQGYYFGLFWEGMPDLNYTNPAVTADMLEITDFWLNNIGVDGFRVDAAKHLIEDGDQVENTPATHEWFKGFYTAYKKQDPQAYTIGEIFGAGSSMVKSYSGDQLDHVFNFEMSSGFVNSTRGESNSGVVSAYKFALADTPDFNFAIFLTNHDQSRVMYVLNGNIEKAKMASFLMLTSPGTPYIYYGEEIGMSGVKPDEDIRLPMQWSAEKNAGFSSTTPWRTPGQDYAAVNVELQDADNESLLNHYRALIALRKEHPALESSEVYLLETGNAGVFAVLHVAGDEVILVLANLKGEPISDYLLTLEDAQLVENLSTAKMLFGTEQAVAAGGSGFSSYKPFDTLAPYGTYLIQFIP
jgi:glycosidase